MKLELIGTGKTHQSGFAGALYAIDSQEKGRGALSFFKIFISMFCDLLEDKGNAVLRFIVDDMGSHG